MRIVPSQRRRRTALVVLAAVILTAGLTGSVIWTTAGSSAPSAGSEAPRPTQTEPARVTSSSTPDAPRSDPLSGVDPRAAKLPPEALLILAQQCPGGPPVEPGGIDQHIAGLEACLLLRQLVWPEGETTND